MSGRHPAPPQSARRSPGEPATPPGSTRHSRRRAGTSMASARRSALPALEGSAGPWVSLCSSAPGDTVGYTCTPTPAPARVSGRHWGQSAERGSGCHSIPEERGRLSSTRLVRFRTGLPGTLPTPAVPLAPQEGLQSLPRRGRCGVSGEAGVEPTFAGAGVAPSPSALLSRGWLLRALAPGHVPPAFLQPRCWGRDANTDGSLGGPHGHERAVTRSPGGRQEAPSSPSVAEAGGAGAV